MDQGNKILIIAMVILGGIALQAAFAMMDNKETPHRAVVEFSKAYFKLDAAMADRLCEEQQFVDDVDVVDQYIYEAVKDIKERGFGKNFAKNKLYTVETHTTFQGADKALVSLHGKRRIAVNPVYPIISKLFSLGETYTVDAEMNVVKEDGKWKVCDRLSSIFGS
ncbi:MAG: hypothetical protein JRF27_06870 [Deltaproteobacteria bacterium]|nr:hypothetical protein [Deltaproteobacteria bacterium]